MLEGHAREFVSKIQNMRKENGYEVSDRINIYYCGDEFKKVVDNYSDYIKNETLCINLEEKELKDDSISINGIDIIVKIEKI